MYVYTYTCIEYIYMYSKSLEFIKFLRLIFFLFLYNVLMIYERNRNLV